MPKKVKINEKKRNVRQKRAADPVKREKISRFFRRAFVLCLLLGLCAVTAAFSVSAAIVRSTEERVISEDAASLLKDVDCVIVLGCGVYPDGTPSPMLRDRVTVGVRLFENETSPRLLMSGDHGSENYDEVNTMKKLAADAGIDPDAVFCDHAGFSTYESLYRARDIFGAKKIVIVTQEYHLYRALYIARKLGLDAWGVSADERLYAGSEARELREIAARFKDFFFGQIQPLPTYLGDPIPLDGSGSLTDG